MVHEMLSASEMQIEEKAKRMQAMIDLAIHETFKQIREEKQKSEDLETIVKNVSEKGINIKEFLHGFIKLKPNQTVKTQVSYDIAKGYFEDFSECAKDERDFITFNAYDSKNEKGTHFHLRIEKIREFVNSELLPKTEVKFSGKPDKPKKR
jgi:hypothetical protein